MLKNTTKNIAKAGVKRIIEHKSADRSKFWNTISRIDQRLEDTKKEKMMDG